MLIRKAESAVPVFDDLQDRLQKVEFVRIRFQLQMVEDFCWTLERALELRTCLIRAAGRAGLESDDIDRFDPLFDPPVSTDPAARRRYQKPAPGFAIHLPHHWPLDLKSGELLPLEVIFWGDGNFFLEDFLTALDALGRSGLDHLKGRFQLNGLLGADATGYFLPIARGEAENQAAPPVIPALWWLDSYLPFPDRLRLTFHTPLRLVSGGRPLFQCDFKALFPFLLRRVTSMCHAYCRIDLIDEPAPLLDAANQCRMEGNSLRWHDVRTLQERGGRQALGGLLGCLDIELGDDANLFCLLKLGSLLNLGKGAAFGAGGFSIVGI